ncbi:myrosinase 1-like isoform X2 [Agrilus planipennis]|uniref:Myrosinase 1-like isoform X2 n=1 Tax=Agrilus planipennis TaxID=224129 RepID=A0A7F5RI03_AGRPL|nr:myrosinase 1-like isoform X2 [Agrilus planipennis]
MQAVKIIVLLATILNSHAQQLNTNSFPDDFLFGVGTSAYQVEGAWNESDKSENIWDQLTHNYPDLVIDGSNGDVACDSYHHIDDDIAILRNLGVDFYRFSISWTRLLPNSYSNVISETGLQYYNNLIDALLAANIIPMVTIYHWDLPTELQKLGGWANPIIADYFADYAQVAFEQFGDRVKYWITLNEPQSFCPGYGSPNQAPVNVAEPGIGEYLCSYTALKAHAKAYHIYDERYRSTQQGVVGITALSNWFEPNTTSPEDIAAAEIAKQFNVGLYMHAIFGRDGDYPEVVKQAVANRSALEGFPFSRLPELTEEEIQYIKGTADFFGVNHYMTYVAAARDPDEIGEPSMEKDRGVSAWFDPSWEGAASSWLKVVPWGFSNLLMTLNNEYGYPMYVTENGYSDYGEIDDSRRTNYYQLYLSAVLDALSNGANIRGYTAWSLMDNFEWLDGFVNRFGLYYVNVSDPRTIKSSGEYFKQVIATRVVTTTSATVSTNGGSTTQAPTYGESNGGSLRIIIPPLSFLLLLVSAPVVPWIL